MELSELQKKQIRFYKEIEFGGMTFYPILVCEYDAFMAARPAIELMQQTLPVRYVSMPLLQAYYAMDYDAFQEKQPIPGFFSRCLLFLALSLRLGEWKKASDRIRMFKILHYENDPSRLVGIEFCADGETWSRITPVSFSQIRPIVAAQNGIELVSESANPELVEAERDLAERNAPKLDMSIHHLIDGICTLCGTEPEEIDGWPILKLLTRKASIRRVIDYVICGINAGNGAKWKGGNPYPDPFYPKKKDGNDALIPMSNFMGQAGNGVKNRSS